MLTMLPAKARRNPSFSTRMNPASTTKSTSAVCNAATYARSASSSSLARNLRLEQAKIASAPREMVAIGLPALGILPARHTGVNHHGLRGGRDSFGRQLQRKVLLVASVVPRP